MNVVAALLPEIDGIVPAIFVLGLLTLAGAVGAFAVFVIAQQFRNPGRRS